MTDYQRSMLKNNYENAFQSAISEVRNIRSGNTGHTRPDVAYNQIEHGLALKRQELVNLGISVPYFKCSNY